MKVRLSGSLFSCVASLQFLEITCSQIRLQCYIIQTYWTIWSVTLFTSLIQGIKAATWVKPVGLFGVLYPRPSTKLVTPTYHFPSLPLQFRGPPESPWTNDCRYCRNGNVDLLFVFKAVVVPHVTSWLAPPSCADHGRLYWAAPPVSSSAGVVIHHRK